MTEETTRGFTDEDFSDHVTTYRMFVRGVTIAVGSALLVLIVLAYATL